MSYTDRGDAYCGKGDYDQAIADYNEAIRLDPDDALTYIGRGDVYYSKGDYDRAVADYDTAVQIDPAYDEARQNLKQALEAKATLDTAPFLQKGEAP